MYKVVIKLPDLQEKVGSVWLPDRAKDQNQLEGDNGVIVAVGQAAFSDKKEFPHSPPKIGDKVFFQRWEGFLVENGKGEKFRIIEDNKIAGVYFDD